MTSPKTMARLGGSLYLLASVLFVVSIYVRSGVTEGGPAHVAAHIRSSPAWFRLGLTSDLLSWTCFLMAAFALYLLLHHVSRPAAAAMVLLVAVLVTVGYVNDVNQFTALTIATDPDYANALGLDASNALVALSLQAQGNGLALNEMFWGLWLLPLGYLVITSRQFPRLVGFLLIVAALNWLAQFVADVIVPGIPYPGAIAQIGGAGELVFVAWLLILGIRPRRATATDPAPAF